MAGSWLLVFTSFMIFFLEMGTLKSFGVLFNPMLESLQCTAAQLGAVIGMTNSIGYIIAPITGNIARRHGSRVCMMTGGVLLFVGHLASAFVGNVFQLSITLGIITGVGMGLSYIPQIIILMAAFPTRFPLVFGIAAVGGSLGMMVCPPIVELLVRVYGWRGAMMIIAAFISNICAFGELQKLQPLAYSKMKTTDSNSNQNVDKKDISFCGRLSEVVSSVASWLSLNIFVNEPRVVVNICVWFLQGFVLAAWMVFLVPHATARDIPVSDAVLLSTGGGVGNLFGRVILVHLLERKLISAFWMFVFVCVINAVVFFLDSVVGDMYTVLMALACVNGAATGILSTTILLVSKEIYDERYHVDIYVIGCCFYGFGEIVGSSLAGLFYDLTQSYDAAFFGLGVISAVVTALTLMDRFASRCLPTTHDN